MGTSLHSQNGCWAKRRQFSRQKCDGTLQLDGTILWPILVELSFKIHNLTEQISGKQYQLHKIITKHRHFEVLHAFPLIYMAIIVKVFKRKM